MRAHVKALHFRGASRQTIEMLRKLREQVRPEEGERALELGLTLALVAMRHGDYRLAIHTGYDNLALVEGLGDRQRRCAVLLDLALAEQFAGQFDASIAHNREALSEAEEIGARDDIGLLNANLCMVLRRAGSPEAALEHGRRAVAILAQLGLTRMEAQARTRVGHALSQLGRWEEADAAHRDAMEVWEMLKHSGLEAARAGRAYVLARRGRTADAVA
jgi:tetratricopeptide (TPR) repeat protein